MSNALALRTEASARHEKSLRAGADRSRRCARRRAPARSRAQRSTGRARSASRHRAPRPIALRVADVQRLLGLPLHRKRSQHHLAHSGCEVDRRRPPDDACGHAAAVAARSYDCRRSGRRGCAHRRLRPNPRRRPVGSPRTRFRARPSIRENWIAQVASGPGYREIVTHSLRGAGLAVEVRNPLSEEQRFLRDSLAPGISSISRRTRAARASSRSARSSARRRTASSSSRSSRSAFPPTRSTSRRGAIRIFLRSKAIARRCCATLPGATPR